jgi:hypothetical protein
MVSIIHSMPVTKCIVCGWLERYQGEAEADWNAAKERLAAVEKGQDEFEFYRRREAEKKTRETAEIVWFQIDLHQEIHHDVASSIS